MARAKATERGLSERTEFLAADCGVRLPFDAGTFDAALCIDAINHLLDRRGDLSEWARLLRPGGRLLYTDPLRDYRPDRQGRPRWRLSQLLYVVERQLN